MARARTEATEIETDQTMLRVQSSCLAASCTRQSDTLYACVSHAALPYDVAVPKTVLCLPKGWLRSWNASRGDSCSTLEPHP